MTTKSNITWEDLKNAYDLRIAHLLPSSRKTAEAEFLKLQEKLHEHFPEAFENPTLLRGMNKFELINKLRSGRTTTVYIVIKRTLDAIKKIEESVSLTPDLNADLNIFTTTWNMKL